jgi:hypothetical protein
MKDRIVSVLEKHYPDAEASVLEALASALAAKALWDEHDVASLYGGVQPEQVKRWVWEGRLETVEHAYDIWRFDPAHVLDAGRPPRPRPPLVLSDAEVREMRDAMDAGLGVSEAARRWHVSVSLASRIRSRERRADV